MGKSQWAISDRNIERQRRGELDAVLVKRGEKVGRLVKRGRGGKQQEREKRSPTPPTWADSSWEWEKKRPL